MRYVLAVSLCLTLLGAGYAAEPRENVMPNAGFEEDLAGWTGAVNDPTQAGARVVADTTQPRAGAQAVLLDLPAHGSANLRSPRAPVEAGKDYLLTLWFRSEGFSATGQYDGVNASYAVRWLDGEGQQVGALNVGLPYGATPEWTLRTHMMTAPAGAEELELALGFNVNEGKLPSKLWLDQVQVRWWPGEEKPGGERWVFPIAAGSHGPGFRRVADDDTETGFAVIGSKRFEYEQGYLAGGMYTRVIPPGQYRVSYRLKVQELPGEPVQVAQWDINTPRGHLNGGTITTADFGQAGRYEDKVFRFVAPPDLAHIDFRAFWPAQVTTWIDTITVVEEKIFTEEDLEILLD